MICLKNRTFAVSQTTLLALHGLCALLWFAWKIVLLQYRKQLREPYSPIRQGCDLLEKSYFCSIANNTYLRTIIRIQLWFAWKIVLLQYRKQHAELIVLLDTCCDLLEKSYFCSIANNCRHLRWNIRGVVICLKNRTFAVSQTTGAVRALQGHALWFAWKIVLLQYRKQHEVKSNVDEVRCDLLEKSYFCSIANNTLLRFAHRYMVVICLKNRTFAVSQTTAY